VQFAGGYDLLQLIGAGGEYDVGILPHIWFENSPLVMLEHLHAGKLVISSRLGGPPEWLVDGRENTEAYNALLFAGGEPEGLAEAIRALVVGEVELPSALGIHEATPILQSYPAHVAEVDSIYQELVGDPASGLRAGAQVEAKSDAPRVVAG
jgi:glycosyltransferase involved in cell wall biosynthesis